MRCFRITHALTELTWCSFAPKLLRYHWIWLGTFGRFNAQSVAKKPDNTMLVFQMAEMIRLNL